MLRRQAVQIRTLATASCLALGMLTAWGGCSSTDERIVSMATEGAKRQAEQSREMVRLQEHVAEGTKQLAAVDARSRHEWTALKHDIERDLAEVGRQRDVLEDERRNLGAQRQRDPIVAAAIEGLGILLACLAPLSIAYLALRLARHADAGDYAAPEVLIGEILRRDRLLLNGPDPPRITATECPAQK